MTARSLSMRRAWIEISQDMYNAIGLWVALHAESVDRNTGQNTSSSDEYTVALHAESVDRNNNSVETVALNTGRSPCGERG